MILLSLDTMRHILEESPRLRVRDVRPAIPASAIQATLLVGEQVVEVIGRLTNLHNGYRHHFLCPRCRTPRESLYRRDLSEYACRVCLGLVHASWMKKRMK